MHDHSECPGDDNCETHRMTSDLAVQFLEELSDRSLDMRVGVEVACKMGWHLLTMTPVEYRQPIFDRMVSYLRSTVEQ